MTTTPIKPFIRDIVQQGHTDEAAWETSLPPDERAAMGTEQLWSARDHLVHRNFGRANLIQTLTAILNGQAVLTREKINDEVNGATFTAQRQRPWDDLRAESERIYTDLLTVFDRLTEADLMDDQRFTAVNWGHTAPLYTAFLGYWYEHGQEHLTQYFSDRGDLPHACSIRARCADRIAQSDADAWIKGWFRYNLATFYAQQNLLPEAATALQAAIDDNPKLRETAQRDPELAALRDPSA